MRIGILGGTFNPVHLGHLLLAEGALQESSLDQVLWVPAHVPPHKSVEGSASVEDRVRMVELAIQGHPCFQMSRIEVNRPPPSYTIDTVRQLQSKSEYAGADWFFLVGSDTAQELSTWKEIGELMKKVQFVAVPRPGRPVPVLPQGVTSIPAATLQISASEIRRRLQQGKSVRYLMPDPVLRYIKEKGLYR